MSDHLKPFDLEDEIQRACTEHGVRYTPKLLEDIKATTALYKNMAMQEARQRSAALIRRSAGQHACEVDVPQMMEKVWKAAIDDEVRAARDRAQQQQQFPGRPQWRESLPLLGNPVNARGPSNGAEQLLGTSNGAGQQQQSPYRPLSNAARQQETIDFFRSNLHFGRRK